jgi:hypothetical protein
LAISERSDVFDPGSGTSILRWAGVSDVPGFEPVVPTTVEAQPVHPSQTPIPIPSPHCAASFPQRALLHVTALDQAPRAS